MPTRERGYFCLDNSIKTMRKFLRRLTWNTALRGSGIFLSIRITYITNTTERLLFVDRLLIRLSTIETLAEYRFQAL